jgi:radical SAM superfamily enzyme YgiQ (UPF0313 family)
MKENFLLVTTAGVPKIISDFIPDIGLSALAASLMDEGCKVKILDFNQPSLFSEVFTDEISNFLERFSHKVFIEGKSPSFFELLRLRMANNSLEKNKGLFCTNLKRYLENFIEKEDIGCVGFKLWAGDGFRWSIEAGRYLKKKHPELKIIGGGPQVDIFGQEIYKVGQFFDALCYGEGEETIKLLYDFVRGKGKLEDIPNIIFRRENGSIVKTQKKFIDSLDTLPMPVYTPDVYTNINEKLKMLVIEESRGCPYKCYYCIHPIKSGRRKTKSSTRVVSEMKEYGRRYGVKLFKYAGSTPPGNFLEEVARRIIEEKVDVRYTTFGHVNDVKTDFSLLKKSGCESIFFGMESADEEILKKGMNRTVNVDSAKEVLRRCRSDGIFTVVSFIYPAPFETEKSREKTMNFIKDVRPDSVLVQFSGIYPGTQWFETPERFNFTLNNRETYPLEVMTYQIKNLFPPSYWDPLPYRINGMAFKEFARETERFQKDLQKEGIETSIPDEAYLLYMFSRFNSLREFLDKHRCFFYSGNRNELEEEISFINGKV